VRPGHGAEASPNGGRGHDPLLYDPDDDVLGLDEMDVMWKDELLLPLAVPEPVEKRGELC
jgi:hypothetical protein